MARKLLKERSAPSAHSRKRMIIINRYQTTFISRLVHSYCGLLLWDIVKTQNESWKDLVDIRIMEY